MTRRQVLGGLLAVTAGLALPLPALARRRDPVALAGTRWEAVATEFGLDPVLLYAIGIIESKKGRPGRTISPWPWALRSPAGPWYGTSHAELLAAMRAALAEHHPRLVDVGLMQVNVGWHGHRVDDVEQLTDPETNLRVSAEILSEALSSAPDDLLLGIGRYHSWRDAVAREYARQVMHIYHRISDHQTVFNRS